MHAIPGVPLSGSASASGLSMAVNQVEVAHQALLGRGRAWHLGLSQEVGASHQAWDLHPQVGRAQVLGILAWDLVMEALCGVIDNVDSASWKEFGVQWGNKQLGQWICNHYVLLSGDQQYE